MGYRDARENEAETIPWLGEFAAKLEAGYGRGQDRELELLKDGVLARWPTTCPDDALDRVGVTFQIVRFSNEESDTSYRARENAAWETWTYAGTTPGVVASIQAWGIPDVEVKRDHDGHFASGDWYSRYWTFLGPNYGDKVIEPLTAPFVTPCTGGTTATAAWVRELKKQAIFWKAPHGYPVKIILRFGGVILGNINSTPPFTPPEDGGVAIEWRIGKLIGDTVITAEFVAGGYFDE